MRVALINITAPNQQHYSATRLARSNRKLRLKTFLTGLSLQNDDLDGNR